MSTINPRAGDILSITREASVQFLKPMMFRVIRIHDWPTYDGWMWLDGYQLNSAGDAVERRSIFVQQAGLARPGGGEPSRTPSGSRLFPGASPDFRPGSRTGQRTGSRACATAGAAGARVGATT